LCCLLSYYSRDTFSKRKNEMKFEKIFTYEKSPSTIRRKIPILFECFERKFTNYFRKTKILTVLPWANKAVFKELWCNPDKRGYTFSYLSGFSAFSVLLFPLY